MADVQPPRNCRARQSEAEECEDDAWSMCFADERSSSDSSDDDDDDEEVRRLEAALAAAKAKKKRRRGSGYDTLLLRRRTASLPRSFPMAPAPTASGT